MRIKDLVLRKGWAGKTISRAETASRFNTLIRSLIELMHAYDHAIDTLPSGDHTGALEPAMSRLRADIGKLSETVHSCGVVSYSGTDIEPGSISADKNGWSGVLKLEAAFSSRLKDEKAVEHQMRSRAVLGVFASNSEARMEILRNLS
ncbi:MAG: hypothetical protein IIA50_04110 [Bacteroidetes bacterium]|nr:hypothetical protein [Bacteroidota bacterium]